MKKLEVKKVFTPNEIAEELAILSKNLILVGQAVNVWSEIYGDKTKEPWKGSFPFTSRDIDVVGNLKQMLTGQQEFIKAGYKVTAFFPRTKEEEKINTGALQLKSPELEVNVLKRILAVNSIAAEESALTIKLNNNLIKVLHPLLCMESKAACLLELDQKGRNDKKHLILCIGNIKKMIQKFRDNEDLTEIVEQILKDSDTDVAVDLWKMHKIRILDAIPWEDLRKSTVEDLKEIGGKEHEVEGKFKEYVQLSLDVDKIKKNLHKRNKTPKEENGFKIDSMP